MMSERKVWSEQEQFLLKHFYEEEGIDDWAVIAKRLLQEYHLPRKSAKQCRERYENHIKSDLHRIEWTPQQMKQFIKMHNQMGNKWASIAAVFKNKSDISVKNHFYSTLRRVLRRLNSLISTQLKGHYHQISITTVCRFVEIAQERFKFPLHEISNQCLLLINRLLELSINENEFNDITTVSQIVQKISKINKTSRLKKRNQSSTNNLYVQQKMNAQSQEITTKLYSNYIDAKNYCQQKANNTQINQCETENCEQWQKSSFNHNEQYEKQQYFQNSDDENEFQLKKLQNHLIKQALMKQYSDSEHSKSFEMEE